MNKKMIKILLLVCLILNSTMAFASAQKLTCNYDLNALKNLIQFGTTQSNISLTLTCCGNSAKEPGVYLKESTNKLSYQSCLNRFKNGIPKDSYAPEMNPLICLGAGLSEAWASLKSSASGLWDMLNHPIATASQLTEFGKLLLTKEGRSRIYQLIRKAIQDEAKEFLSCLTPSEKEEKTCQLAGAFVSNFVPPALLIKGLLITMKTGKTSAVMSKMAANIVSLDKSKKLNKTTFSKEEITKNSLLNNTQRVAEFEKLMKLPPGTFANNPKKANAILLAHNQKGTIGKLNFSQIKARVRILKANGFTQEEIRRGLDAGIFGNPVPTKVITANPLTSLAHLKNESLKENKVLTNIKSTKHDSGQSVFKGDNNLGIEILEGKNGEKIFAKIKYPPSKNENFTQGQIDLLKESFIVESQFAKKLSDLGIGPKFKGVYQGKDGKYRIATEYVEGFEVHLGETPNEIKKLKLSTIHEMKEKALIAVKNGIDPFDLQYRISNDGTPYIIDPEHFSMIDPSQKAQIIKEIEKDFALLLKDKVQAAKK